MPIAVPTERESWHAWFVVGILFPLHVVLGVLSLLYIATQLYNLSPSVGLVLLLYAPFYMQRPERAYPGWKGFEWLWRMIDYDSTCASYFGAFGVHGGEEVDREKQYFVASHPHGTVIFSRTYWRSQRVQKLFARDWRMVGAKVLFSIPVIREFSLWFGALEPSKSTCEKVLRAGCNLVVYPGGLDEANGTDSSSAVTLRTRTGFIRLAIKHGVAVLPTFCFGELDAVRAVRPIPAGLALWLRKKFRVSTNVFVGRYGTFVPKRAPFNLIIGRPIAPAQNLAEDGAAFEAEVARIHAAYKEELRRMYRENQARFGYEDRQLVFACEGKPAAR